MATVRAGLHWQDVELLLAVDRARSLSLAAKALGIDQSTVSRRLRQLEDQLDCALFVRSKSGVLPDADRESAAATRGGRGDLDPPAGNHGKPHGNHCARARETGGARHHRGIHACALFAGTVCLASGRGA